LRKSTLLNQPEQIALIVVFAFQFTYLLFYFRPRLPRLEQA
jgi:hypothetical protein